MRKQLMFFLFLLLLPLSLLAQSDDKTAFIDKLLPLARDANSKIMAEREQLLTWQQQYQSGKRLSAADQKNLHALANKYQIKDFALEKATSWDALKTRVDKVPLSLLLAQGAIESAWGRSRFFLEGNSLFGQWCLTIGCGLVPAKRPVGATYEVRRYENLAESVESYLLNLNSHAAYNDFRHRRAKLRGAKKRLTGLDLVDSLKAYSANAKQYRNSLVQIIKGNRLHHYDHQSNDGRQNLD